MIFSADFNGIPVRFCHGPEGANAPFFFVADLLTALTPGLPGLTDDERHMLIVGGIAERVRPYRRTRIVSTDTGIPAIHPAVSVHHAFTVMQALNGLRRHPKMRKGRKERNAFGDWFCKTLPKALRALGYGFFGILAEQGFA